MPVNAAMVAHHKAAVLQAISALSQSLVQIHFNG